MTSRDMTDAHSTAEATHLDQESDTMTDQPEPYDFHDEAERALLNDNLAPGEQASLHALLAIHDTLKVLAGNSAEQYATLAEIRDRRADAELYFDEAESVESHKEPAALSSAGELSALLAIKRLLTEIRDRLPERAEADLARVTAERDDLRRRWVDLAEEAGKWRARHEALRADVGRVLLANPAYRVTLTDVLMRVVDILDADTKRGEQG